MAIANAGSVAPLRRPNFRDLAPRLQQLFELAKEEETRKANKSGGLLSKLRGKA